MYVFKPPAFFLTCICKVCLCLRDIYNIWDRRDSLRLPRDSAPSRGMKWFDSNRSPRGLSCDWHVLSMVTNNTHTLYIYTQIHTLKLFCLDWHLLLHANLFGQNKLDDTDSVGEEARSAITKHILPAHILIM